MLPGTYVLLYVCMYVYRDGEPGLLASPCFLLACYVLRSTFYHTRRAGRSQAFVSRAKK